MEDRTRLGSSTLNFKISAPIQNSISYISKTLQNEYNQMYYTMYVCITHVTLEVNFESLRLLCATRYKDISDKLYNFLDPNGIPADVATKQIISPEPKAWKEAGVNLVFSAVPPEVAEKAEQAFADAGKEQAVADAGKD